MTVLRSRLVSLRLSEAEYQQIKELCQAAGGKSISRFIRISMAWIVLNYDRTIVDLPNIMEIGCMGPDTSQWDNMVHLRQRIKELHRELEHLRTKQA